MSVLILGGAGVFGSRLARLLVEDGHDVIIAGRSLETLNALAGEIDVRVCQLDRADIPAMKLAVKQLDVRCVIDAAGPFQDYQSYEVAEVAIEMGCTYLDLSDDAKFTSGIKVLDKPAKVAGVAVLSGVSSVPAISGTIIGDLTRDWQNIALIETAILPGNRAPRGVSVMQAILTQVGAPLRLWRAGQWEEAAGWSDPRDYTLPNGDTRQAALIGAPDLALFPEYFGAETVEFRAGLELGVMQKSLALWSWLRARGLAPNGKIFVKPLRIMAKLLEPFGSDVGGMMVRVVGQNAEGVLDEKIWTMEVGQGKGPFTPTLPACLLVRNNKISPGARPAIEEFSREEVETEFARIGGRCSIMRRPFYSLFETTLGSQWTEMPEVWRQVHSLQSVKRLRGHARVSRGTGFLSRVIGTLFRFPAALDSTPVEVRMERHGQNEHWIRKFGSQTFRSVLSPVREGVVRERFGPFQFEMNLPIEGGEMAMPVTKGWCMGLPMPKALLPRSETREFVKDERFHFDVRLSAPIAGLIVHYQGWLE